MKWSYAASHWLITLLLAPLTSQLIDNMFGKNPHRVVGLLELYPITLIFSVVLSLPTLCVYLIAFYFLSKTKTASILIKLILIAISVTGIFVTIMIIAGMMTTDVIVAYSVTAIIVGIVLRMNLRVAKGLVTDR
jgi:hypothetical protein